MRNLAIPAPRTRTCPAWCTDHQYDADGHTHAAKPVTIAAGTVSMSQITEASPVFDARDQPTIWLNDEPLPLASAAELSAILAALVAAGLGSVSA